MLLVLCSSVAPEQLICPRSKRMSNCHFIVHWQFRLNCWFSIAANVGLPKIFVYFHYRFPPRSSPYSLLRYVKRTFCRSFHRSNALASNFTRIQVKQKGPIERLVIPLTTDLRKWRRRKAHSRRFWPARTCSRSHALPGIRPKNLPDHHQLLNGISCPHVVAARRPGSHIDS